VPPLDQYRREAADADEPGPVNGLAPLLDGNGDEAEASYPTASAAGGGHPIHGPRGRAQAAPWCEVVPAGRARAATDPRVRLTGLGQREHRKPRAAA
jgi:hypothetical protein